MLRALLFLRFFDCPDRGVAVFSLNRNSDFAECFNFCVSVEFGHVRVLLLDLLSSEICCGLSNVSFLVLALQWKNRNACSASAGLW